jgi:hypothetical protein
LELRDRAISLSFSIVPASAFLRELINSIGVDTVISPVARDEAFGVLLRVSGIFVFILGAKGSIADIKSGSFAGQILIRISSKASDGVLANFVSGFERSESLAKSVVAEKVILAVPSFSAVLSFSDLLDTGGIAILDITEVSDKALFSASAVSSLGDSGAFAFSAGSIGDDVIEADILVSIAGFSGVSKELGEDGGVVHALAVDFGVIVDLAEAEGSGTAALGVIANSGQGHGDVAAVIVEGVDGVQAVGSLFVAGELGALVFVRADRVFIVA